MPPSVRRLEFRPRARADLADIFQYSVDVFGIDRARVYITALDDVLIKLVAGQANATKTGTRGTWRVKVGSHNIYFRRRTGAIVIVRVLHQVMDAERHLRRR